MPGKREWRREAIYLLLLAAGLVLASQPRWELLGNRYLPLYHLQARAFLEGRADIHFPAGWWPQDSITVAGKHYLAMGPLVGLLLTPFLKVFGDGFSERALTLLIFAGYLFVIRWFVRARVRPPGSRQGLKEELLWASFLSLGTGIITCTTVATAWFSAVLLASLLLSASAMLLLTGTRLRDHVLSLLLLCAAALSRYHLALLIPVWTAVVLFRRVPAPTRLRSLPWVLAPGILYGCAIGAWNWIRFGSLFDLKYSQHHYSGYFGKDVAQHGMTALSYIKQHVYHGLVALPKLTPRFPFFEFDPNGNGIFALSPLFLLLFWRKKSLDGAEKLALASLLIVITPVFLHFSTGWRQFGYRYALDFLPFLALLLAGSNFSIRKPLPVALVAVSLWFQIWGTWLFVQ